MSGCASAWPLDAAWLPNGWTIDENTWTPLQRQSVEMATEILTRFTAGQFGQCTVKLRPCRIDDSVRWGNRWGWGDGLMRPLFDTGRIYPLDILLGGDLMACGCMGLCGCAVWLKEITLDPFVFQMLEVRVNGTALPTDAYRVDDWRRLLRTDGDRWPLRQDLTKPDTEPDTWSVTYVTGNPVSAGGRAAVTTLAVELAKAGSGDKSCALPSRVTQVVRDGVSWTLADNLEIFDRGRTGLARVDLWLASVNPFAARAPMAVYSPDLIRARRNTLEVLPAPGEPPTSIGKQSYTYVQASPQTVWMIQHGLGFYPGGVRIEDSDGIEVEATVTYPGINVVRIEFNTAKSGVAHLS